MIKSSFIIVCVMMIVLHAPSAHAQDHGFGVGIVIGEPTGFSLKGWLDSKSAVDVGLAWSFVRETSFHVHADYLFHSFNVFKTAEKIPLYYGIGGRIKTAKSSNARVGVRAVVGLGYYFKEAPLDLFLEVAPIVDLAPATELQMNAGLGIRYFFK